MEIDVAWIDTDMLRPTSGAPAPSMRDEFALRALGPADQIAVCELLLGLDDTSRVKRFNSVISDDGVVCHARRALHEAAWIAGLFAGGELCGVVELYETCEPGVVEASFAVASRWRRRGVGTALLFAALAWAHETHRIRLHMIFERCNWPMRRLASKAEPTLDMALDELVASVAIGNGSTNLANSPARHAQ